MSDLVKFYKDGEVVSLAEKLDSGKLNAIVYSESHGLRLVKSATEKNLKLNAESGLLEPLVSSNDVSFINTGDNESEISGDTFAMYGYGTVAGMLVMLDEVKGITMTTIREDESPVGFAHFRYFIYIEDLGHCVEGVSKFKKFFV